jgi:integrase
MPGDGAWRLRYRINGRRFTIHVKTKTDASEALQKILGSKEKHVAPARLTVAQWADQWLALLERNPDGGQRKRGKVNPRTLERYGQLLGHVKAKLGNIALQKLTGTMVDDLYIELAQKLAVRTILHVHNVLRPCLASAAKKRLIVSTPADDADAPPGHRNVANVLDENQFQTLVRGFRGHALEWIVDIAANTGARRNEIIALRSSDLDLDKKTLTIARSVEETIKHGRHVKEPKTERGNRTIAIAPDHPARQGRAHPCGCLPRRARCRSCAATPNGRRRPMLRSPKRSPASQRG